MYEQVEKTPAKKNKKEAHGVSQMQNGPATPRLRFVDNRPEAIQMRRLRDLAKNSPQNNKLREIHHLAAAHSVIQKQSNVKQGFGFVDNRPESIALRKMQTLSHDSDFKSVVQKVPNATGDQPGLVTEGYRPPPGALVIGNYSYGAPPGRDFDYGPGRDGRGGPRRGPVHLDRDFYTGNTGATAIWKHLTEGDANGGGHLWDAVKNNNPSLTWPGRNARGQNFSFNTAEGILVTKKRPHTFFPKKWTLGILSRELKNGYNRGGANYTQSGLPIHYSNGQPPSIWPIKAKGDGRPHRRKV